MIGRNKNGQFVKGHHSKTEFKKGQISWIKDKHHTKETKRKLSEVNKGKKLTEKHKRKIGEANKGKIGYWLGKKNPMTGKHHSEITKKKMSEAHKGHFSSEQTRKKLSESQKGKKSHFWKGGISFELYGLEFNKQLKEKIRKQNQYRCQQCFRHQDELRTKTNRKYKLLIHHIDYNKQNNNSDNLISLCRNCHSQTNFQREDWTNYFKNKCQN